MKKEIALDVRRELIRITNFRETISVYMKGFDDEDPIECFNEYISDYE